jgi:hypothetical protein
VYPPTTPAYSLFTPTVNLSCASATDHSHTTRPAMNRTVIIVKNPYYRPRRYPYGLIRLHWQYGQEVEDWLRGTSPDWDSAWRLIQAGHRSSIEVVNSASWPGYNPCPTLRGARSCYEYLTLAYHNGKSWRFEHKPQGV